METDGQNKPAEKIDRSNLYTSLAHVYAHYIYFQSFFA